MKSEQFFKKLKLLLLYFFSIIIVATYLFLILWTYCYSLYVNYLLITSLLASLVLYYMNHSKRQAMKFILLGLIMFCLLSPFNIKQYNRKAEALQNKISHNGDLTTREKMGVYGCLIMVTVFDFVLFPEAAKENFCLFFPNDQKQKVFFSNSFLESPSIQKAIQTQQKGYVVWNRWNFRLDEVRYALAFNPCKIYTAERQGYREVVLTTEFGYRENHVTIHATNFLRGIFTFRVDEGLFYYLQERGWLHPYKAIWKARMPV